MNADTPRPLQRHATDKPRKHPEKEACAWCWQDKAARRFIRERAVDPGVCLGIYDALTEIVSDQGSLGHALTTNNYIAQMSGVSVSTVKRHLQSLREIGVINYPNGQGRKCAREFTIYSMAHCEPALVHGKASKRATLEEQKKEKKQSLGSAPPEPGKTSEQKMRPTTKNPQLERLATIGGTDPSQITKSSWAAAQKALNEIKTVCPEVTVEEIERRAANYRAQFNKAALTPHALAKWWAQCDVRHSGSAPIMERKFSNAW